MLKWLTNRHDHRPAAERLYGAIVAQSRLPVFYASWGVPDTVTGRFEMIVLHMFLVLERLRDDSDAGGTGPSRRLGQALNETFVSDMDDAMREMGVADVRVSKRMHQTAGAFFGRLMAYRTALEAGPADGRDPLVDAIARNVLADGAPPVAGEISSGNAPAIAAYCRAAAAHLNGLPIAGITEGTISFPMPEAPGAQPAFHPTT